MGLKLITPPATDPITLAEAKAHLRVIDNDDDVLIAAIVKSATANAEGFLGRALVDQTWDLYLDAFPTTNDLEIKIPLPPLIGVVSVNYFNSAGIETQVNSDAYYVDNASQPGWIVPTGGRSWPTTLDAINAVRVTFRAGYLDNSSPPQVAVPFDIRAGILLTVGSLYEHREQVVVGTVTAKLPWGVEQLLRPHRVLFGMA